MATDRAMRASDQDRESAAELLREAYVAGRLSREELDERAAAAYSATTWGELRDLTADLPPPAARTGLPSDIVVSRRGPQSTERRLIGQMMIWTFVLPLAGSYVIQGMRMLAVTWANATRGKSVFWLHTTVGAAIWPSVDDRLGITPRASSDSSGYIFATRNRVSAAHVPFSSDTPT